LKKFQASRPNKKDRPWWKRFQKEEEEKKEMERNKKTGGNRHFRKVHLNESVVTCTARKRKKQRWKIKVCGRIN